MPTLVPPNFHGCATKIGEFLVRVTALCESQESITVGSHVSPFESFMTTGISVVLTVVLGFVCVTNGFLPTIV